MTVSAILRAVILIVSMACAASSRAEVTVIEYYHSVFNHYFVTPIADEIAKLDARVPPFESWSRTGRSFRAYEGTAAASGSVAICRFFNDSFSPKSSHFYAPIGLGCESTLARFPDWRLEDDKLFAVMLPDAAGACPTGTNPVYRLYNDGRGGAPNHRFVTSAVDRQAMLDQGYVAEGAGIGVGMCAPVAPSQRAIAEGYWRGFASNGQAVRILVRDDGAYYIVYSDAGTDNDAGVVIGTIRSSNGGFESSNAVDVPFSPGKSLLEGPGLIIGTYTAQGLLILEYGGSAMTIAATYDGGYDDPPSLASLAGHYIGSSGHVNDPHQATATLGPDGQITIFGQEFELTGFASPRGSVNVFDIALTGAALNRTPGVQFFDRARQILYLLVPFDFNGPDVLFLIARKQ